MPDATVEHLNWLSRPALTDATMILAFTGWMDGGDVSTGTVERLVEQLNAQEVASIDSDPFYIYNFPGSMEVAALFRPHIRIRRGVLREIELPDNTFYVAREHNLVLFVGREPNLRWQSFGACVFATATALNVKRILFVGSFAGSVPHTREPRLFATVSSKPMLKDLRPYGIRPSDYEGPGSFMTYLMSQSEERALEMLSLAAEIPAYIQGTNPLSIEAVTRRLAGVLGLPADLAELRTASNEWESEVSEAVDKDQELAEKIRKLEEDYDDDLVKFQAEVEGVEPQA